MSNYKSLYTFTVDEKSTSADTPVVKHHFSFKKPSRAEREDADMWHAGWVNKCLEKGLIPQALLIKQYANAGGVFNDADKAEFDSIRSQLLGKQLDHERAMLGTDLVLRDTLTTEILDLRERFLRLQQSQETFFSNTAEAKAREKLIEWLILHLSYHRIDESKPWEPFFIGDDTQAKIGYLEKLEDEENDLYLKSRESLAFIASLYVSMNGNLKKEDIDAFLAPAPEVVSDATLSPKVESQPAA